MERDARLHRQENETLSSIIEQGCQNVAGMMGKVDQLQELLSDIKARTVATHTCQSFALAERMAPQRLLAVGLATRDLKET